MNNQGIPDKQSKKQDKTTRNTERGRPTTPMESSQTKHATIIHVIEAPRVKNRENERYRVYSDSYSSIQGVTEYIIGNHLTRVIYNGIRELITQGCSLKLFSIKAHVGHRGNEKADALDKEATRNENIHVNLPEFSCPNELGAAREGI